MMLTGNNGILTRAGEARDLTGERQTEEQVKLATSAALADGLGTISYTNLNNELKAEFGEGKYDIDPKQDAESWTVTVNEQTYTISSIGKVEVSNVKIKLSIAGEKVTTPPKPDLTAFAAAEVTKIDEEYVIIDNKGNEFVWVPVEKNQKITLKVDSKEDIKSVVLYNPIGEKIVEEANKGINYTAEIETFGNANCINGEYRAEVETESGKAQKKLIVRSLYAVDAFNDYYKTDEFINVMIERMRVKDKAELYDSFADYTKKSVSNEDEFGAVYSNMMVSAYKDETEKKDDKSYTLYSNSVNENGGFYIARFEAGVESGERSTGNSIDTVNSIIESSGTPVSKINKSPYNYVTRDQAKELAKNIYAEKSDLLTGAAWDRTMDWIINQNDRGLTIKDIVVDSKSWGNYSDSSFNATGKGRLAKTGAFEDYTKVNNIYDLAGNVYEWSSETKTAGSSSPCVYRGGRYGGSGSSCPASFRSGYGTTDSNDYFRVPFRTLFVDLSTV